MIIGIGLDIVNMARIAAIYRKFGRRFLIRILSEAEMARLPANAVTYLAGRFAAKEAAAKALGSGFSGGITFRQMEIINNALGEPVLRFHERAEKRFKDLAAKKAFCSITHEHDHAAAVVILEG